MATCDDAAEVETSLHRESRRTTDIGSAAIQTESRLDKRALSVTETPDPARQTPLSPDCSSSIFNTADWLSTASWTGAKSKKRLLPNELHAESDDGDSVSSTGTAYFQPTDFDASNWVQVTDATTVGFAFVALSAAITHPILFLAGAITAVGAATAASRGYDLFSNGSLSSRVLFCFNPTLDETIDVSDDKKCGSESPKEAHPENDESTAGSSTDVDEKEGVTEHPPNPERHHNLVNASTLAPLEEDELTEEWFDLHYPPLSNVVKKEAHFVGLNVIEFFHVFYDDDAPYNFYELQKKRGDKDITYGQWTQLAEDVPLSLLPSAKEPFPKEIAVDSFRERILRFKAKTNSYIGPAYATTKKTQRILIMSKRKAVLEMKTELSDIPYSDRFFVMERWMVSASKEEGRYTTTITASCEVKFTQSCAFENQIRTKSTATVTDVVSAWCGMATEALKLTEQAKLNRLRQSGDTLDLSDDELTLPDIPDDCIEVKHSEDNLLKCVVVEGLGFGDSLDMTRSESEPVTKPRRGSRFLNIRRSFSNMSLGRRK